MTDTVRSRVPVVAVALSAAFLVAALVVANVLHDHARTTFFADDRWNINRDLSYAEWLGYLATAVAAAVLARIAWRRRSAVHGAWGLVLLVVCLDDLLRLHERGGRRIAGLVELPAGLGVRAVDLAELLVWAAEGAVLLAVLVVAHRRSGPAHRAQSWRLAGLLLVLATFGVVVDLVHQGVLRSAGGGPVTYTVGLVEGAGELLVMVALLAYTLHLARSPDSALARPG